MNKGNGYQNDTFLLELLYKFNKIGSNFRCSSNGYIKYVCVCEGGGCSMYMHTQIEAKIILVKFFNTLHTYINIKAKIGMITSGSQDFCGYLIK